METKDVPEGILLSESAARSARTSEGDTFRDIRLGAFGQQRYSAIWAWTAVMATTPTMSLAEQPRERSFTGLAMPCRMGP